MFIYEFISFLYDVESCNDLAPIVRLAKIWIVPIVQFVIPAFLILMGTIDIMKAVISGKAEDMSKDFFMFFRRIIYGVSMFMVISTVLMIFSLAGDSGVDGALDWINCWNEVG